VYRAFLIYYGEKDMLIYGKRNLKELIDNVTAPLIPGIAITVRQYWILPIYRVEISYTK
jgi:hypothetical protein